MSACISVPWVGTEPQPLTWLVLITVSYTFNKAGHHHSFDYDSQGFDDIFYLIQYQLILREILREPMLYIRNLITRCIIIKMNVYIHNCSNINVILLTSTIQQLGEPI